MEDNINFDMATANEFLGKGNYTGLIDYLSQFKSDDPKIQADIDNELEMVRLYSSMLNAVISRDGVDKDAIIFREGINRGIIPDNNTYSDKYREYLSNLGSTETTEATGLKTEFKSVKDYDSFMYNSKYSEEFLKNNGIDIYEENGRKGFRFNKTASIVPSLIQNLATIGNAKIIGLDKENKEINITSADIGGNISAFLGTPDPYRTQGAISGITQLRNINDLIKKADANYNLAFSGYKAEPVTQSTIVTGRLGAAQSRLYDDYASGKISEQAFTKWDKIIKDRYLTLLSQVALTQYDVYAYGPDSKVETMKALDSNQKKIYTDILRSAIDDNRVTFSAAMSGALTGTMITISPKASTSKPDKGKFSTKKNFPAGGYQIFVPNLFRDSAEEAFNRDTKTRAMKEVSQMNIYKYNYHLQNGEYIGDVDDDFAIRYTKDNEAIKITRQEAQNLIDGYMIKRDGVKLFRNYKNQSPNIFNIADSKLDIADKVFNYAVSGSSSIYGNTESDEYKRMRQDIYSFILDGIGYNSTDY